MVSEHFTDGSGLKNLSACCGRGAAIEECRKYFWKCQSSNSPGDFHWLTKGNRDTAIFNRSRKAASSSTTIRLRDCFAIDHQWPSEKVITLENISICVFLVHVSQRILHALRRKHIDVLYFQGSKDFLLEIIIQWHPRGTLDDCSSPIDAYPVFPIRTSGISFPNCSHYWTSAELLQNMHTPQKFPKTIFISLPYIESVRSA